MKHEIQNILTNGTLDFSMHQLAQYILSNPLKKYEFSKKNGYYSILDGDKPVYKESDQHVTAVAKLMRIPKELWLLWAAYVVTSAKAEVNSLPLESRITLFREAFKLTIEPFYEEELTGTMPTPGACLNCGSSHYHTSFERNDDNGRYFVYICDTCGLGMRYPRTGKEALDEIYTQGDYFSGNSTLRGYFDYDSEASWRIEKGLKYLKQIEKYTAISPKKTHILDIGSGYGYFLKAAKDSGYTGLGVELAPEAVDVANTTYKAKTIQGDIVTLFSKGVLKEQSFGLITLWDIIEHFYDVNEELEVIGKLLQPGGYVALRTNNIDSVAYTVFGKYFHSVKDEHTYYYTKENLSQLFMKVGIEPVKVYTHTHLFLSFMSQKERNVIDTTCQGEDIFFIGQKK